MNSTPQQLLFTRQQAALMMTPVLWPVLCYPDFRLGQDFPGDIGRLGILDMSKLNAAVAALCRFHAGIGRKVDGVLLRFVIAVIDATPIDVPLGVDDPGATLASLVTPVDGKEWTAGKEDEPLFAGVEKLACLHGVFPHDQVWVWWTGGLSWRHRARYAAGL